jgi:hypothetical protein
LAGVAVKVTLVPEQIVAPGFAEILTPAVTNGLTVIVIALEVAGLPETHTAFEFIIQVITSPSVNDEVAYAGLLLPTFVEPFFHW